MNENILIVATDVQRLKYKRMRLLKDLKDDVKKAYRRKVYMKNGDIYYFMTIDEVDRKTLGVTWGEESQRRIEMIRAIESDLRGTKDIGRARDFIYNGGETR